MRLAGGSIVAAVAFLELMDICGGRRGTAVEPLAVAVAFEAAGKPLVMESFGGCCDYKT